MRQLSLVAVSCLLPLVGGESAAQARAQEPGVRGGAAELQYLLLERPPSEPIEWILREDPDVVLEVGGSVRQQYEAYTNFELSPLSESYDDYHLHRAMVHLSVSFAEWGRMFGEVGSANAWGKENPLAPVDDDEVFIHQAFAEIALPGAGARLRVGRQELSFGSGRLVSLRDGPNIRRSFDAASLKFAGNEAEVEIFAGAEVRIRPENFDNRIDNDVLFWGAYGSMLDVFVEGANVDVYYFGLDRDRGVFEAGVSDEQRHSVGVRIWGEDGRWDYNFEPVVQFGRFGERDIAAWTIASDTGWRVRDDPLATRLGLRADVISGGQSAGTLQTFNALFPNNSYFSEAAIFAPSNLIDLNPTVTVFPRDDLALKFLWDFVWRFDGDDAIYGPPGVPILPGGEPGSFVGHALSVNAEFELAERLLMFASYAHFEAGNAVRNAGGTSNLDYFLVGMDWRF